MYYDKKILNYIKIAFTLFLLSAIYGWLIRLSAVNTDLYFAHSKFLQAHSHVAFLGWGYITTCILLNSSFLNKECWLSNKYKRLFTAKLVCISLMLISFPLLGYKAFSIILLSAFGVLSYFYVFYFLRDLKTTQHNKTTLLFVRFSMYYYVLSSLATWTLGIIMTTIGKGDFYYNTVFFYLHFLYNGFFIFAFIGLLFRHLSRFNYSIPQQKRQSFFWLINLSCIPTYALSLVSTNNIYITLIGGVGAVMQLIALGYLIAIITEIRKQKSKISIYSKMILYTVYIAFSVKVMLQFFSAFPSIRKNLTIFKSYFVIGYIHLVTLGIISAVLLFFLIENKTLTTYLKATKIGVSLFLIGLIGSELLLFTQGGLLYIFNNSIPFYYEALFIATTILILGILFIWIGLFIKKTAVQPF